MGRDVRIANALPRGTRFSAHQYPADLRIRIPHNRRRPASSFSISRGILHAPRRTGMYEGVVRRSKRSNWRRWKYTPRVEPARNSITNPSTLIARQQSLLSATSTRNSLRLCGEIFVSSPLASSTRYSRDSRISRNSTETHGDRAIYPVQESGFEHLFF